MLTKALIDEIYNQELSIATTTYAINLWAHQPASSVAYIDSKTKLGLASCSGQISINTRFLATATKNLLINTLRHEISHLIAGVGQGHNKHFKRVASTLEVKSNESFEELAVILSKIDFKYTVIAHFVDGGNQKIGGAHRKTAKYTRYNLLENKNMSIEGRPIKEFEFVVN